MKGLDTSAPSQSTTVGFFSLRAMVLGHSFGLKLNMESILKCWGRGPLWVFLQAFHQCSEWFSWSYWITDFICKNHGSQLCPQNMLSCLTTFAVQSRDIEISYRVGLKFCHFSSLCTCWHMYNTNSRFTQESHMHSRNCTNILMIHFKAAITSVLIMENINHVYISPIDPHSLHVCFSEEVSDHIITCTRKLTASKNQAQVWMALTLTSFPTRLMAQLVFVLFL